MEKNFANKLVKDVLQHPFEKRRYAYLVRELLNHIEETPETTYRGNYIPDAYKEYVTTLDRIGKYVDPDGKKIDILIIHLKKQTSLERARTMQRNFVAWFLKRRGEKDAALAAFISPDQEDWRFSFIKMEYKFVKTPKGHKAQQEFTPARRYSFLVGENENSHTAQSCLAPILIGDEHNPTLKEIEDAFSIEKVTKEFFLEYRKLFLRTKEELDMVIKNDPKIKADFEAKGVDTVNFAKKLLGQIVFLYFLQKKGWFGVGRDNHWGTGSKHFLRELFEKKHSDYNNLFNDILEPLFYEALRIDRSHDDDYYSRFDCKIPFLNGGLFDPIGNYDWVHTDILLPDSLFSNTKKTKEGDTDDGILDIFDRYNFTVKEDEPLEKEVAIDPELLGKTYEKFNAIRPDNFEEYKKALKSGKKGEESKFNKKFGVYYTPREIVHYMCQQSLINYLETELDKTANKEDIETLIHIGEHVSENEEIALIKEQNIKEGKQKTSDYKLKLPESIRKNAALIDQKLADITVCDPAAGSGAFPVGMMSEIVRMRSVLSTFVQDNTRTPYEFKRRCIEHSLYGVDIDSGAVEIARLRLWLSLVVDEDDIKNIKPLPNLDYKVVCGNSLLGYPYRPQGLDEIEKLKDSYFNETRPNEKIRLRKQIDRAIYGLYEHTKKSLGYQVSMDFRINFSEVFHNKDGFDVVIANPPYVGQKGNKNLFDVMKKDPNFEKKMDYWYFFLHKAHEISNSDGTTTFITPNYWITARGGRKLRKRIVNYFKFLEWINFDDNNIFEAGIHTNVFILQKSNVKNTSVRCTIYNNKYDEDFIINRDKQLNFSVDQNLIYQGWTEFVHFLPENILKIISKLITASEKLCDTSTTGKGKKGVTAGKHLTDGICNLNQGLVTGKDRYIDNANGINEGVFVLNEDEKNDFDKSDYIRLKDFYKNSDISQYYVSKNPKYYLVYVNDIESESELKKYARIYDHLCKYKDILLKRSINGVLQSAYKKGKWWALTTDRPNINFDCDKILCPQRSRINTFGYSDSAWYAASDVFYISLNNKSFNLKYITAIINSKLIYFWLFYMGKRKGDLLELTLEPLQFIPIKRIPLKQQKPFIQLIDNILCAKQQNPNVDTSQLEKQIDQMVYKLYDLTKEEIDIVKGVNKAN